MMTESLPRSERGDQARTDGILEIPGLSADGDSPDPFPFAEADWFAWYPRALAHRVRVMASTSQPGRAGQMARDREWALCQQPGGIGLIYWVTTFCFIAEPRADGSVGRIVPWIPWPRQVELFLTIDEMMNTPGPSSPTPKPEASMAVEKTRACGFSWCDLADHAHRWLFEPFYTGLLISRTEDDVDKPGDAKALMWKLDFLLGRTMRKAGNIYPTWLLPQGFQWERAASRNPRLRTHLSLVNPETGGQITGTSSTEDAGRGDRRRKVTIDEAAHYPYFDEVWNLLAMVTDHRVAGSSAGLDPPGFYHLVHGQEGYTRPRVFRYEWHQIPGHDQVWLAGMRASMKLEEFEVEILIKYRAGQGKWIYPDAQQMSCGWYPWNPDFGPTLDTFIDDGGDDGTAIVVWQPEPNTLWRRCVGAIWVRNRSIHQIGCLLTGELDNSARWTKREEEWARWAHATGLRRGRFGGCRHGEQTNQVTQTSPFQELTNQFGIWVQVPEQEENSLARRRDGMNDLLPYAHFHEENGAPAVLEAISYHRWKKPKAAGERTSEDKEAVHDDDSHYVTACEYYAVLRPIRRRVGAARELPPNIGEGVSELSNGRFARRPMVSYGVAS